VVHYLAGSPAIGVGAVELFGSDPGEGRFHGGVTFGVTADELASCGGVHRETIRNAENGHMGQFGVVSATESSARFRLSRY
jgi:hypothetical protein